MPTDEDNLRRIIRQEDELRRIIREELGRSRRRPTSTRRVDPELSAKRSAAAKAMWAKMKAPQRAENKQPGKHARVHANVPRIQEAWRCYAAGYKLRYGEFPARTAETDTHLGLLVEAVGASGAARLVEYYLSDDRRAWGACGHALGALVWDLGKTVAEWRSGAPAVDSP